MGLNDVMAKQIMGELDAMTRSIDDLHGRIEETRVNLFVTLDMILTESVVIKETHDKALQDQFATALLQIKAGTQGQIEVLNNAAMRRSAEEIEAIRASAETARNEATVGVLALITQKFESAMSGVASANLSFTTAGTWFKNEVNKAIGEAKGAVSGYNAALQNSAAEHQPVSTGGFILLAFGACLVASMITAAGVFYVVRHGSNEITPAQLNQIAFVERLNEIYPQLDKKTKETITKLWKQQ
ncbi:hypothetical protein GALL_395040 [mine drainage metagenome]|uniref:Uncharacterized protein n=1 Tax=mine drainage metagenome TaxID=410659 RepID=A0A1J5Q544_9ZZZZ